MKVFSTSQIRLLDQYTIEHEPIASIDLMERAAKELYNNFIVNFPYQCSVCILAGQGNNGGDALTLARLLLKSGYSVNVILLNTGTLSSDCEINKQRLLDKFPGVLTEMKNHFEPPHITNETIVVDGLFGSGLNRALTGFYVDAVNWINNTVCKVISIDIPSGLNGEKNDDESALIVKADLTLTFQFPKLAFLLSENNKFVGKYEVLDIGLHPDAIKQTDSNLFYLEEIDVVEMLKQRPDFSHKGTYGHAYLVAGSIDMAGAAVLSGKAALRSGAGIVTVHSAAANRIIVQTAFPEAIFESDVSENHVSKIKINESYKAVGVGPGIGTHQETVEMLRHFLSNYRQPCVLDADALNIISQNRDLLSFIPHNSILTPHPKEFERMFGKCNSGYDRMEKAAEKAKQYKLIIILKGANTLIATADGKMYFNSTGNSGMATAGSGDVLTGMLVGLLAQGYSPEQSALMGVYLHGMAGDLALENQSKESLIAGDIILHIGSAFRFIQNPYR